jgi:hypothetical protein
VRPAALSNPSREGSRSNGFPIKPLPPTRFRKAGGNIRLANRINPTESTNQLIWTALIFHRPRTRNRSANTTSAMPASTAQELEESLSDRRHISDSIREAVRVLSSGFDAIRAYANVEIDGLGAVAPRARHRVHRLPACTLGVTKCSSCRSGASSCKTGLYVTCPARTDEGTYRNQTLQAMRRSGLVARRDKSRPPRLPRTNWLCWLRYKLPGDFSKGGL